MADQLRCIELTRAIDPEYMKYAVAHKEVIEHFGRFPHRNRELGRENTPQDQAWPDPGGAFSPRPPSATATRPCRSAPRRDRLRETRRAPRREGGGHSRSISAVPPPLQK